MSNETIIRHLAAPLGELERSLIAEFIRARGYDPNKLGELTEHDRHELLAAASVYASGKLGEVEARSHFLDEIHDGTPTIPKSDFD